MNRAVPKIELRGIKKRFGPKIVLDGNLYKSKARYTSGQLLVQGKAVDLPVLAP